MDGQTAHSIGMATGEAAELGGGGPNAGIAVFFRVLSTEEPGHLAAVARELSVAKELLKWNRSTKTFIKSVT